MSHPKLQPSYILCIFLILKMFTNEKNYEFIKWTL
jgi:hypothetical protein